MNVEYVDFIFENCEVFRIAGEDIGELYLDDINHRYRRITADFVERFEYANIFFIEINDKEAVHQHFIILGMEEGFDA